MKVVLQVWRWIGQVPKAVISLLLLLSLILNILVQSSSLVARSVSGFWSIATGSLSVLQDLSGKWAAEKAANAALTDQLSRQAAKIESLSAKVAEKEAASAASQVASGGAKQVLFRGEKVLVKDAVADVSRSITSRMRYIAGREVASLPGASVPWFGIAILLGMTAYDLKAQCENAKELHDLDVAFNPEHEIPADQNQLCGMQLPTRDELWKQVKESPRNTISAASSALGEISMPDLPNLSDIPSFSDLTSGLENIHWKFWQ